MIELILVIVVLGIVSSITASIIVRTYESYIIQRALHRASLKTELAVSVLVSHLTYRIPISTQAKKTTAGGATIPLSSYDGNDTAYNTLEWIEYDHDGFSTSNTKMGWSGFCDLNNSTYTDLSSLGSHPAREMTYLNNIFQNNASPAIYFVDSYAYRNAPSGTHEYNATCMHTNGNSGCMFPVTNGVDEHWTLNNDGDRVAGEMIYTEFYQLAASAYAVVPTNSHTLSTGLSVWDLYLHRNYQPWDGDNYNTGGTSNNNLLLKNVSVFRFNQTGESLRIKICSTEVIGGSNISICKEKAVMR